MKTIINFFKKSNRYKHLYCGFIIFIIALFIPNWLLPAYAVSIGAATAEFKDKQWHGVWDIIDFGCTVIIPYIITLFIYIFK